MAINKYSNPIQQTQEQYVGLPFEEMLRAGQAIQARGDAADLQNTQVQSGLSSMEALAPGYSQFRDKFANDFKSQASKLLDQYGGNTSNPEFIRASRKLNMQYANDPRLQTIKQGNELYKQNQQIAAKMQAEGKLFLQPKFTGVDANGNITANVPGVQAVNTLEDWTKAGAIAHESMEDIGTNTTNSRNLGNWKKTIQSDTEGKQRLTEAYIQQGLSPERAKQAVENNIKGLVNQYGKVSKVNTGLLNLYQNQEEFAYRKSQDRAKLDIDRFKAETARLKATGKGAKEEDIIKAPSFNEFTGRVGSIAEVPLDAKGEKNVYVFGSGASQYGTANLEIKNQKVSGKIYDISDGKLDPTSKSVDVKSGTLKGYVNAWVDAKTGKLLATPTNTSKPRIETINGKSYAYKDGKPYEVQQRTMAEYNYLDKTDDKEGSLKTFYKAAAPKDAMREMGYSNAYYEGMGRVQHGSSFDSKGKARLDYNYIQKNISSSPEDIKALQKAEADFNAGRATDEQKQLLQVIGSYDSRKSTYDNEILPYFKDQSKSKSIVQEEE